MNNNEGNGQGHGFGTMPVFLASISTILGAVMFLRFGYAVGNVGLLGAIGIVLIGHMVTIPTALAIAEIATNRKVEGGGEYFIISRSFGVTIGSVIGLSLYMSQALSVAFYMIAFAEGFTLEPFPSLFQQYAGFAFEPRMVSIPATIGLILLMLTKGAALGVKALYVVVSILTLSLVLFFLGDPVPGYDQPLRVSARVPDADPFFVVFAIVFPAFTGMTAGVGLSGDLANPRRSIPLGTLSATFVGMLMYIAIIWKLAASAPADLLAEDQLVMYQIAMWGPIIPIGLASATMSSAIGSILVAPRTLQALAADRTVPFDRFNNTLSAGVGPQNEPRNATLVTGGIALLIASLGNVDAVARLISMFFMVTYGSLCAISFLEHMAARPSYRPSFKSRWWISLFGAWMCFFAMFQMDPVYAVAAILVIVGLYFVIMRTRADEEDDLAAMFQGVMTQLTRYLQIQLQRRRESGDTDEFRPSVLMVNGRTFDRRAPLEFLRWLCHRYGFGTYLHYIPGALDAESYQESVRVRDKLIKLGRAQHSPVYMDTIVSPSLISALAQSMQVPGVSGLNNNTVLFEFSEHDAEAVVHEVVGMCNFAAHGSMNLAVLRHGDLHFGERRNIHIWITWNDRYNANLMILLAYILLGHPDWADAEISVFAALPSEQIADRREAFENLVLEGRIPISEKNIRFLPVNDVEAFRRLVETYSAEADLSILGFDLEGLRERQATVFHAHPKLRDVLYVCATEEIAIQ